ncbi:MAG: acetyltransferase [Phycisphaerales bacterium]|nr:acetyltransferase [Phycisphaerales bacterium]
MLYNSFHFLFIFLPACLLIYFVAARIWGRLASALLMVMSFVFYAWDSVLIIADRLWEWLHHASLATLSPVFYVGDSLRNLRVIAVSIVFNFALGVLLRWRSRTQRFAYAVLCVGVIANVAALAYFKYANFLLENFAALTGHAARHLNIILPLGISFFTFTQIAFLVDAYRGRAKELGFSRYGLFVSFFPHLIAGPIVHHSELMPQFASKGAKRWNAANVNIGIAFLSLGLFKKIIIADSCAPWAARVFETVGSFPIEYAWRGAIAYTMQLYFDFSGYSDMAIGLAMMFNIRLPDNFDSPYKSVSIVDFWRRWHMTLSRFLRDYLYIPLGGNRKGESRRQVNLMLTMLIGGIWHGAGWTFAVWGLYHGVLLTVNHAWARTKIPLPSLLARLLTFVAVVVGWVVFRAKDLGVAGRLLRTMVACDWHHKYALIVDPVERRWEWGVLIFLLLLVNFGPTTKQWVEARTLTYRRAVLLAVMFFICLLWMHDAGLTHKPQPFIYFNF